MCHVILVYKVQVNTHVQLRNTPHFPSVVVLICTDTFRTIIAYQLLAYHFIHNLITGILAVTFVHHFFRTWFIYGVFRPSVIYNAFHYAHSCTHFAFLYAIFSTDHVYFASFSHLCSIMFIFGTVAIQLRFSVSHFFLLLFCTDIFWWRSPASYWYMTVFIYQLTWIVWLTFLSHCFRTWLINGVLMPDVISTACQYAHSHTHFTFMYAVLSTDHVYFASVLYLCSTMSIFWIVAIHLRFSVPQFVVVLLCRIFLDDHQLPVIGVWLYSYTNSLK